MYSKKTNVNQVKKSTQPKNVVPNNRPGSMSQNKNESQANWVKERDQQLLNLVKEYLQKNGYNRAFNTLKTQRPVKRIASYTNNKSNDEDQRNNGIIQAFQKGNRQEFFKHFSKYLQGQHDYKKYQFELNIYFCIYSVHPCIKKSTIMDKNAAQAFRKYLEAKGSDLPQTNQFLSFFALPYIQKPQENTQLSSVFTKQWLQRLKNKTLEITNSHRQQQSHSNNMNSKRASTLQQLFFEHQQKEKQQGCKENCKHIIQLQEEKNLNKQLHAHIDILQDHFKKYAQSAKSNLLQSNMKWFQFSKQLLSLIRKAQRGQKIQRFQKYEAFLSKSVEQLIYGTNDISLFDRNSYIAQQLSITPQQIQKHAIKKSDLSQLVCQVDLNKIVAVLSQPINGDRTRQTFICLVLKALKDRFMKLKNPYARRQIIISYSRHDICGVNQENGKIVKNLFIESSQKIREFYFKLLNFISTDFFGILYLSSSEILIKNIIKMFHTFDPHSHSRKYALGVLQRLSSLKKPQKIMMANNLLDLIIGIFKTEREQLTKYARQFLIALIMNLSLRKFNKAELEKHKSDIISILLDNLQQQDHCVKNFVNGSLYTLIQISNSIRQEAIKQNTSEKIQQLLKKAELTNSQQAKEDQLCSNFTTLARQYKYILDKLNEKMQLLIDQQQYMSDSDKEDGQQEEGLDDIDDEQEEQMDDDCSSSDQWVQGQENYLSGDELLLKQFPLLGPDALKQQILTRSVLDENSRRVHNMTVSINKSRRMDNIYGQRAITPSLLTQLDYSINNQKT